MRKTLGRIAKRLLRTILGLALISLANPVTAQDPGPSLADFAFLNGYWVGTGFGGKSEEIWMPASDGSMFGIFKQSSDAGITFTEFLEITRLGEDIVLRLKHFNPDFTGWEEKSEYVTFRLQSVAPNKAEFSGLSYTLVNDNTLRIELRLRNAGGDVSTEVFELQRRQL